VDAFGPASAVVAEFFERLRRSRVLARTYFRHGGIEAVYDDVPENIGLMAFAQWYRQF
jgi:hypothetical protein